MPNHTRVLFSMDPFIRDSQQIEHWLNKEWGEDADGKKGEG